MKYLFGPPSAQLLKGHYLYLMSFLSQPEDLLIPLREEPEFFRQFGHR